MMYEYMTLADETEVCHSQIIEDNGISKVFVNFERPTDNGFDSARCVLPTYEWVNIQGYDEKEISKFNEFLKSNAHLIFKYARFDGINIV